MADDVEKYEGRYVIWGPPGTGKTRFLARQVEKIVEKMGSDRDRSPVCVCSLTRTAASEIASRRMPIPRKQVGTLHAHAYRQLGKPPIAEVIIEDWNENKPRYAIDAGAISEDVDDMARDHDKRKDEMDGNALYDELNLLRAKMTPREHWPQDVLAFSEEWEDWKRANGCIDFTDMIDFALRDVGTAPGAPDVMIADECLAGGSKVALADGTTVSIEEVVRDRLSVEVLCFDHHHQEVVKRKVVGWHKVLRRERRLMKLGSLLLTEDHPVFAPRYGGYIQVKKLVAVSTNYIIKLGYENVRYQRQLAMVKYAGVQEQESYDYVYCIDVEDHHNFFANGVLVHNCQDLSALEHGLTQKWSEAAGASMIAGDPFQAIFSFRGADPSIFLDPDIPDSHRRILSQSYRVPERVKTAAMQWARRLSDFKEIEYRAREDENTHEVIEGELRSSQYTYKKPEGLVGEIVESVEAGRNVMICASCSYMLKPMIHVLRKEGIPFCNPRRRRRGDWNPLRASRGTSTVDRVFDFLRIDDQMFPKNARWASQRARLWTGREFESWAAIVNKKKTMHRGSTKRISRLAFERADVPLTPEELGTVLTEETLKNIMLQLGPDSGQIKQTGRLVKWLYNHAKAQSSRAMKFPVEIAHKWGGRHLFDDPKVYIGTIHSFKGFEADHVIIFPDLSPAGLHEWLGAGSDGVIRTFYVAITRAKEIVTFCRPHSRSAVGIRDLAL